MVKDRRVYLEDMTYDEWFLKYKPIPNPQPNGMNYVNELGETTYGAFDNYDDNDREMLLSVKPNQIWTLTNEDNHDYLLNGIHFINRMEHYICEVPFEDNLEVCIDMGCCCDIDEGESCEDCEDTK